MRTRTLASLIAAASLVLSATTASAAGSWETADVVGQGLAGPVVAADGAATPTPRSPSSGPGGGTAQAASAPTARRRVIGPIPCARILAQGRTGVEGVLRRR